jgi:capsular polysaccharide transport system permease protein
LGLDTLIGGVTGGGAGRDTLAVRDYILSRDMLNLLENEHGFRKHFSTASIDWISRLPSQATLEDTYEYYEDVVRVDHDSTSGVLTLRVLGFHPTYSHEVSTAILGYSEKMVNQLSERARLDQTKLAQQELELAERRLSAARKQIVELQQKHSEFSPEASATGAMALRTQLQGQLATARAELMQAKAFMQPNAPRVIEAEARVQSLSAQVSGENRRLVNPTNEKGLSTTYAKFEAAMVEKEFAQSAYQSALTSLEMARIEGSRQHRYLATISRPSLADEETHPRRIRAVFTAFLLSMMLFGIISLMVATVREHARV